MWVLAIIIAVVILCFSVKIFKKFREEQLREQERQRELSEINTYSKAEHVQKIARTITQNDTMIPAKIIITDRYISVWKGQWTYNPDSNCYWWNAEGGSFREYSFVKDFNVDNIPGNKVEIVANAVMKATKLSHRYEMTVSPYHTEDDDHFHTWYIFLLKCPPSSPPIPPERKKW